MSTEVVMDKDLCPHCGYMFDRASHVREKVVPQPGDISMCIGCGEWCVFGDDLKLRKADDKELAEVRESYDAQRLRSAWLDLKSKGKLQPKKETPQ